MRLISLAAFAVGAMVAGAALAQPPVTPAQWAPGDPNHVGTYAPTEGQGSAITKGIVMSAKAEVISAGEIKQPIWVYKPAGKGPFRVVIMATGGNARGMPETLDWLGTRLQAAGIAAVIPTWRAGRPIDDPEDIRMLTDWLVKQPWVSARQIGLYGHSRGGDAAYRAAAADPRIKVLVQMGALSNLSGQMQGMRNTPAWTAAVAWLGDPDKDPDSFKKMDAVNSVGAIKQPTLILEGEKDTNAPMPNAVAARDGILKGGNKNVTLIVLPNTGHFANIGPLNPGGPNTYAYDQIASIVIPYFKENLGPVRAGK